MSREGRAMKKILVLGTSSIQADLVRLCRERGQEVFTCSNAERGPARELSREFRLVDIVDRQGVLDYARSIGADLVHSVGSDVAMPTASWVSEQLGLPRFVSSRTAEVCNSKPLMRETLGFDNPWNLDFQVIRSPEEGIRIPFPLVLKPADSQGQRGVRLVQDREDLFRCFSQARAFSRTGGVILEEFARGPEISVPAYVADGKVWSGLVADRISWPQYPGWIVHKLAMPSATLGESAGRAVGELLAFVAERLGIRSGPMYCQIKITEGGPKLIEVSPRLDGGHLWRAWEMITGVNLLAILLDHLEGNVPAPSRFHPSRAGEPLELEYLCALPGWRHDPDHFREETEGAAYLEWYYQRGEEVRSTHGFAEKTGYVIRKPRPFPSPSTGRAGEGIAR